MNAKMGICRMTMGAVQYALLSLNMSATVLAPLGLSTALNRGLQQ